MKYLVGLLCMALFWLNILPLFVRKFRRVRMLQVTSYEVAEKLALRSALRMLRARRPAMSFNEGSSLYERLAAIKAWVKRRGATEARKYFHYPRAFLMLGLAEYALVKPSEELTEALSEAAERLLDPGGRLRFEFSRLDHCVYGQFFLVMHDLTGGSHFLSGAMSVYESLLRDYREESGWLRYRTTLDAYFIDTIGMACPFLYAYAERMDSFEAASIADRQLELWNEFGLERGGQLPFHGIDARTGTGLGPVNWARGVGWYALGLAYGSRLSRSSEARLTFAARLTKLLKAVENLEGEIFECRQFLANDNDSRPDSSAVVMLQYASIVASGTTLDAGSFWSRMTKLMNRKGEVINCSGDTLYFSRYSPNRSSSELCQGLLMAILCHVRHLDNEKSGRLTSRGSE